MAVIFSLILMKNIKSRINSDHKSALKVSGKDLIMPFGFMPIKAIILQLGIVSLTGVPFMVLLPVFASDILHGGPHTLGFLMAASGVGALCGPCSLHHEKMFSDLEKIIASSNFSLWLRPIIFSMSKVLWLSNDDAVSVRIRNDGADGGKQHDTSDHCRWWQTRQGNELFHDGLHRHVAPFGSLWAGTLASHIGALRRFFIGGSLLHYLCCGLCRKLPDIRKMVGIWKNRHNKDHRIRVGIPTLTISQEAKRLSPSQCCWINDFICRSG